MYLKRRMYYITSGKKEHIIIHEKEEQLDNCQEVINKLQQRWGNYTFSIPLNNFYRIANNVNEQL